MKLVTFLDREGQPRTGVLSGDRIVDLAATNPSLPTTVRGLLEAGPLALEAARRLGENPASAHVSGVKLVAPVPDPAKVICVGLNFRDHAEESGAAIPREPVIFNKFPTAVIGPEATVRLPAVSTQVDYEAELVVAIGRRAKNVAEASALEYVAGYTCGNDISARDWQLQKDGRQWLLGKTFDTFAPTGPFLATRDEIADPHALSIGLRLNGRSMQQSTTGQMIFRIEQVIAYVSQVCTLEPGDLIFTGTPPGVGMARKPPVFLKHGDVCEVEIAGLGTLRNRCEVG